MTAGIFATLAIFCMWQSVLWQNKATFRRILTHSDPTDVQGARNIAYAIIYNFGTLLFAFIAGVYL
jgi:hypothetical protein